MTQIAKNINIFLIIVIDLVRVLLFSSGDLKNSKSK